MDQVLDEIIKELLKKSEHLKELSTDLKDSSLVFESVGILKAIDIIKKYKNNS